MLNVFTELSVTLHPSFSGAVSTGTPATWHRATACPSRSPSVSSHLTFLAQRPLRQRVLCLSASSPVSSLEKACQDLLFHKINNWDSRYRNRNGILLTIPKLQPPCGAHSGPSLPQRVGRRLGVGERDPQHHSPHRWKCSPAECVPIKYL